MEPNQNTQPPMPQQPLQQPSPSVSPQQQTENPGQTLGIVSLITSLVGLSLIGLIAGIVGLRKSKKAGQKNSFAVAGIIISIIGAILLTVIMVIAFSAGSAIYKKCKELGPGVHQQGNTTYTCGVNGSTGASTNYSN